MHAGRQNGYTTFAPHFMMRKCSYDEDSAECRNNCIHHGRYCAMDTISEAHAAKFKPWQARARPPAQSSCRRARQLTCPAASWWLTVHTIHAWCHIAPLRHVN